MSSRRILVVYGTAHGHTAKIAQRIALALRCVGDDVTLVDAGDLPRVLNVGAYDGIIVGSSVNYGRHQRSVRRFVAAHQDELNATPSAFFSVSGAAAGKSRDERTRARRYINAFLHETQWRPAHAAAFGGCVAYTRYNPVLRWWVRRGMAKLGGPTDVSRDHEQTDWAQVRRFVGDFLAIVPRLPARRPLRIVPAGTSRERAWRSTRRNTAATVSAG